MRIFSTTLLLVALAVSGCGRTDHMGKAPSFTPTTDNQEHYAMMNPPLPQQASVSRRSDTASLWSGNKASLLGDRRAASRGDILTVVIEVDEKAQIKNESERNRSGSDSLSLPALAGLPQRINERLPTGATTDPLVDISSDSKSSGDGSVKRSEKLTLRVAATVVDVLPNGVLAIEGSQELRVNYELRELLVSGFARSEDISRKNEITFDKIASARVSYGGRGQITDMQQPRWGQQVMDAVLPY
ncbi:MAG: flagellar basal body L-ring protein FlgH [Shimia sp.]|uniref:flagellar basal body L-ring protein FlgH n=1 Tax=Shimia sp. TaxID=1954381 RepID=UPI0025D1BC1F|nr:flagellar basal body L-ring protein FlgH [Shimia sp.]MCH2067077.1 flagellar basal body L-ring protein FlgH [Shimia sp.]